MIIGLIVVLAVGGTIASSSNTSSPIEPGMRAVIVPTADAARTVLVTPCGTGASVLSANVRTLMQTTGVTNLQLPQGQGQRLVLVPKCSGGSGGSTGATALPSAAFVAPPGTALPPIGSALSTTYPQAAATDSAQFQLTVPAGSPIRTIVVSPCENPKPSGPAQQVLSTPGHSTTVVAPAC